MGTHKRLPRNFPAKALAPDDSASAKVPQESNGTEDSNIAMPSLEEMFRITLEKERGDVDTAIKFWEKRVRRTLEKLTGLTLMQKPGCETVDFSMQIRTEITQLGANNDTDECEKKGCYDHLKQALKFLREKIRGLLGEKQAPNEDKFNHEEHINRLSRSCSAWDGRKDGNSTEDSDWDSIFDLLGTYFPADKRIEIYRIPVILTAEEMGVGTEDLTVVVLAHEYSHAVTHLGKDLDGLSWKTGYMQDIHACLIEGLAQYNTRQFCRSVQAPTKSMPGMKNMGRNCCLL